MPNLSQAAPDPHDLPSSERRSYSRTLKDVENTFERMLREHEEREAAAVKKLLEELKTEAFPDGPTAHKAAHQAMIDAAKQEEEFWRELKLGMAKKSIWGILHILMILAAAGLAAKLGLGSFAAGILK